jgi:hypothetical protein
MRDTELYRLTPTKGFTKEGLRLIAIDAVRDCVGTDCPVYNKCPYAKYGKCTVEVKYLEAVMDSFYNLVKKDMNQDLLNALSLRLMPLFHQLVRFQIFAYSVSEVCYVTARGLLKIHPVFKEIRETIKAIEATQKSIGLDGEYIRALGNLKHPGVLPADRPDEEAVGGRNWREQWNKRHFDNNLGLRESAEKPTLRRAK